MQSKVPKEQNSNYSFLMTIRWQLLLVILPVAIVPLIIIVTFIINSLFSHLHDMTNNLYREILVQVSHNIDFVHQRYAVSLSEIIQSNDFSRIINRPDNLNATEFRLYCENIVSQGTGVEEAGGIRREIWSKIDGDFYIIEFNRKSPITGEPHTLHDYFTFTARNMQIDTDMIYKDPLVQKAINRTTAQLIPGKLTPGSIKGFEVEKRPVMIYPYTTNKGNKIILMILLQKDFISNFYKESLQLAYGTLYILDQAGNVLDRNHPSTNDYYSYNYDKSNYIRDEGDPFLDPFTNMSFSDYRQLNTDPSILTTITSKADETDDEEWTINPKPNTLYYNGNRYLVITTNAKLSNCRLVYFHSLQQIKKPINRILLIIILATSGVVTLIIIISIVISNRFTRPIRRLASASIKIADGDYSVNLPNDLHNEIGQLSQNFNNMAAQLTVRDKKLHEANLRLQNMDRVKSLFFHNISHRLRTPLSIIINYNKLISLNSYAPEYDIAEVFNQMKNVTSKNNPEGSLDHLVDLLSTIEQKLDLSGSTLYDICESLLHRDIDKIKEPLKAQLITLLEESRRIFDNAINMNNKAFKKIKLAGKTMANIIESFSEVAALDATVTKIENNPVQVSEFINILQQAAHAYIEENGKTNELTLDSIEDSDLPEILFFDKFKVETILFSLISNAVIYSDSGTITIETTFNPETSHLCFSICDQGPGISIEDQKTVFTEFSGTATNSATVFEGAGMGLALSKKIAELINATLTIKSQVDSGSTFTLNLPAQLPGQE